jgi:hypothetical protein
MLLKRRFCLPHLICLQKPLDNIKKKRWKDQHGFTQQ